MRRRTALVLFVLGLAAVALVGCGGGEEAAPLPETVQGTVGQETEAETEEAETEEAETEEAETTEETATEGTETETEDEGGGGQAQGNAEAGSAIFNEQGCGGCHVLEAAGSNGSVGPNLDESKPDYDLIVDRVTNGQGVMPAFGDELSEQEIRNVSAYVFQSTQGS
jgi:mono/diheme cytochrome c family protein